MDLKGEIKKLQIDLRDSRQEINSLELEVDEMEKDIRRMEDEKAKAQARTRALENELRVTKTQVDELLSTSVDSENVIRIKAYLIAICSNCRTLRSQCSRRVFSNALLVNQVSNLKITKQSSTPITS